MTVFVAIDIFADNLPYFFHPFALCRLAAHDPGCLPDEDVFIETAGASRLQNSPENLEDFADRAGVKICEREARDKKVVARAPLDFLNRFVMHAKRGVDMTESLVLSNTQPDQIRQLRLDLIDINVIRTRDVPDDLFRDSSGSRAHLENPQRTLPMPCKLTRHGIRKDLQLPGFQSRQDLNLAG